MKKLLALLLMMCCLLCAVAHADICFEEVVSKNLTLHPDEQGEVHDYVILANNGQEAVSLAGVTLCDEVYGGGGTRCHNVSLSLANNC